MSEKKCQKVLLYLSQYLDWDQEISAYLLSYIPVWLTDEVVLKMVHTLFTMPGLLRVVITACRLTYLYVYFP